MKLAGSRRTAGLAAVGALAITLAACGGDAEETTSADDNGADTGSETEPTETDDAGDDGADDGGDAPSGGDNDYSALSGTLNGSGASSQQNAMQAWRDNFAQLSDVTVNYTATGSGTGRSQFVGGEVSFIGTDSPFEGDELAAAEERCGGPIAQLPLYVSPIAIAFNLPGIDSINLSPENIALIFDQQIVSWDDEAIAADNPDVDLPALDIIPVNRFDDSGTSENFAQWMNEADAGWPYEPSDTWPVTGTQSAEGTSGVVQLVQSTEGAITYADASQVEDLGTVAIGLEDGSFVEYSAAAAAAIVDGSPDAESATDTELLIELQRDGSITGAYPIVLIAYSGACITYPDETEAANVQGFLRYAASVEGQEASAAYAAPISDTLRDRVNAVIDQISAG